MYQKHQKHGLVVLGFNGADDRKIALDYMKANEVTFPNIIESSEAADKAVAQYETLGGMSAVPMTYVIGRDGRIAFKLVGPVTPENIDSVLKREIEKALNAPS